MALWNRNLLTLTNYLSDQRAAKLWLAWNAIEAEHLPDNIKEDAKKFLEYFSSQPTKRYHLLVLMRSAGFYPADITWEDFNALIEESNRFLVLLAARPNSAGLLHIGGFLPLLNSWSPTGNVISLVLYGRGVHKPVGSTSSPARIVIGSLLFAVSATMVFYNFCYDILPVHGGRR